MPRKSTIARLDDQVRARIDELVREGGWTLDEILQELHTRFPGKSKPSRSALGRYSQKMEEFGRELRESREVAQIWIDRLGSEPSGDVAKLVMELLRTLSLETTLSLREEARKEGVAPDAAALSKLALTLQRLEAAGISNIGREKQMRESFATEVEQKLSSGPRKLDAETFEFVRRAVRGEAA